MTRIRQRELTSGAVGFLLAITGVVAWDQLASLTGMQERSRIETVAEVAQAINAPEPTYAIPGVPSSFVKIYVSESTQDSMLFAILPTSFVREALQQPWNPSVVEPLACNLWPCSYATTEGDTLDVERVNVIKGVYDRVAVYTTDERRIEVMESRWRNIRRK